MSYARKVDGVRVVILEPTPDATCDLCKLVAELRPYGPNGENICFACGMKDETTTEKQMAKILFGKGLDS